MPFTLFQQGARFSLAPRLDEPFFNAGDSKGTVNVFNFRFATERMHLLANHCLTRVL